MPVAGSGRAEPCGSPRRRPAGRGGRQKWLRGEGAGVEAVLSSPARSKIQLKRTAFPSSVVQG